MAQPRAAGSASHRSVQVPCSDQPHQIDLHRKSRARFLGAEPLGSPCWQQFSSSHPSYVLWYKIFEWFLKELYLELPFGFGISISEIQNDFNITQNGSTVAGLSTVGLFFLLITRFWPYHCISSAFGSLDLKYFCPEFYRYNRDDQHHNR